jgi:hypothetical protein
MAPSPGSTEVGAVAGLLARIGAPVGLGRRRYGVNREGDVECKIKEVAPASCEAGASFCLHILFRRSRVAPESHGRRHLWVIAQCRGAAPGSRVAAGAVNGGGGE